VFDASQDRRDVDQGDDLAEVGRVPRPERDVQQFGAHLAGVAPQPVLAEEFAVIAAEDDASVVRNCRPEGLEGRVEFGDLLPVELSNEGCISLGAAIREHVASDPLCLRPVDIRAVGVVGMVGFHEVQPAEPLLAAVNFGSKLVDDVVRGPERLLGLVDVTPELLVSVVAPAGDFVGKRTVLEHDCPFLSATRRRLSAT